MRRFLLCVVLAVASAQPLAAQTVLYATAASRQRIDAFHVQPDGSLSPDPVAQQSTRGLRPRRLLARGCNLYVAEADRVEVFRIRPGGGLDRIGATRTWNDTRAHDIELYPEEGQPTTLYVPVRRQGAIAAYPLDAEGRPSYRPEVREDGVVVGNALDCVYGPGGADWEDIEVANGKLYAAFSNRVDVYGIVDGLRCSNDIATACTVDDDCRRCEAGHGEGLRCSNDITITCTTSADCAGTCESGLGEGLRCSNDVDKTCLSDADCAPVCANGHLVGAAAVPQDVDGDGTIEVDETVCPNYTTTPAVTTVACNDSTEKPRPRRPPQNCTFSRRGHLAGGVGLVVDGTSLFVGNRFTRTIVGFVLEAATGNFPPSVGVAENPDEPPPDPTADPSKKDKKRERKCRKHNRTGESIRYIGLTSYRDPTTSDLNVFAAGYVGRTDAFRLRSHVSTPKNMKCDRFVPPGSPVLTNKPTSTTVKDVISTPVRTAVGMTAQGRPVLYVAAGERDRVQAFRLFAEGAIDADAGVMQTDEQKDSYPNDVVLVDIANCD